MREINLNGYLDDEVWFGDEITPEALHEVLYGLDGQARDDVHIYLNSYGGSCNAATRMFDDLRAYPGNVAITISGTAASAATVMAMAANRLEMTPGSLYMIHDPIVGTVGNEQELTDAIRLLRACKDSILNVYATRCRLPRTEVSDKMKATCWMDAQAALADGFIDGITDGIRVGAALNAIEPHIVDRAEAEKKVQAWIDRKAVRLSHSVRDVDIQPQQEETPPTTVDEQAEAQEETDCGEVQLGQSTPVENPVDNSVENPAEVLSDAPPDTPPDPTTTEQPENTGTPAAQLHKRLGLIMPTRR